MSVRRTQPLATIAAIMAAIAIVAWMLVAPERRVDSTGGDPGRPTPATAPGEIRGAPLGEPRTAATHEEPDATPTASAARPAEITPSESARSSSAVRVLSPHSFERIRAIERNAGMPPDPSEIDSAKPQLIPFSFLSSFPYRTPVADDLEDSSFAVERLPDQIPPEVRAWNDRRVRLVGFMIPLEFDGRGRMTGFILTQDQNYCCFGVVPSMNAWVTVRLAEGEFADYRATVPVCVEGTLEVGEVIEAGWVTSVYRIRARRVLSMDALLNELEVAPVTPAAGRE